MCGLAGVAGDMNIKVKDGFKDLLLITQLRGRDSTGVFSISGVNEDVDLAKMLGTPEILADTKSYDRVLLGLPKVIAGHCRSKTVGENTRDNAHPYDFDNLVGMHNGTLTGHYNLPTYDHKRTDSFALFSLIDRVGVEEAFTKLPPAGAWALVWWDKNESTLNFLRNDQRPLWFAWTKDRRNMIWASEPWMFGAVARKEDLWDGTPEKEGEERQSPYFQLPPNMWYSFEVNDRPSKGEKVFTLRPIREVKATGNFQSAGSTKSGAHSHRPGRVPFAWEQGGQGTGPFDDGLDDDITDLGTTRLPGLPGPKQNQGGSGSTEKSAGTSVDSSSKISDFRPAQMRGTNSSKPILSLARMPSQQCPQSSNEEPSSSSKSCTTKAKPAVKQVSLRKVAGIEYISDRKSNREFTLAQFEERTKGTCGYCKKPVGGLEEVAEFYNDGKTFICIDCSKPKPIALVG